MGFCLLNEQTIPVYLGEISSTSLGVALKCLDDEGYCNISFLNLNSLNLLYKFYFLKNNCLIITSSNVIYLLNHILKFFILKVLSLGNIVLLKYFFNIIVYNLK